ncbi:MAG: hypothetical protein ACK5P7_09860 [Bdellovibrio sp.]
MTVSGKVLSKVAQTCAITLGVAILIALISGCSVYKSNGRRTFEDKAGDNIVDREVGQGTRETPNSAFDPVEGEGLCWTQPARDPLWSLPENSQAVTRLNIRLINSEVIEVCLESEARSPND